MNNKEYNGKYSKIQKYKRIGRCNKCGECCRIITHGKFKESSGWWKYFKNFGEMVKVGKSGKNDYLVIRVKCKYLGIDNRCSIFNTKKFPKACRQFPHSTDNLYHYVSKVLKVCSFKFKRK